MRDTTPLDGAWWPQSRSLQTEVVNLVDLWPVRLSRIALVRYAPWDWDDTPESVMVHGWRVQTVRLARAERHRLLVVLLDRQHRSLLVIPPVTSATTANGVLRAISQSDDGTGSAAGGGVSPPVSRTS